MASTSKNNAMKRNAVADVFMWENKNVSAGVLGGGTFLFILFEFAEYHLVTFVCHISILALVVLFIWSNAAKLFKKSAPQLPDGNLDEKLVFSLPSGLRNTLNRALGTSRDVASGKNVKMFLAINFGLWVVSVIGNLCKFWTLMYICFVVLHSIPYLYKKYEVEIDAYAKKSVSEIKRLYAIFDANVLSKIPRGRLKDKKEA